MQWVGRRREVGYFHGVMQELLIFSCGDRTKYANSSVLHTYKDSHDLASLQIGSASFQHGLCLKYTKDFINFIEKIKFPTRPYKRHSCLNMDVTSLYTNIPQKEGITNLCEAYSHRNLPQKLSCQVFKKQPLV